MLAMFNLGIPELIVLSMGCCILPVVFGGGGFAVGYFLAKRKGKP